MLAPGCRLRQPSGRAFAAFAGAAGSGWRRFAAAVRPPATVRAVQPLAERCGGSYHSNVVGYGCHHRASAPESARRALGRLGPRHAVRRPAACRAERSQEGTCALPTYRAGDEAAVRGGARPGDVGRAGVGGMVAEGGRGVTGVAACAWPGHRPGPASGNSCSAFASTLTPCATRTRTTRRRERRSRSVHRCTWWPAIRTKRCSATVLCAPSAPCAAT